MELSAEVLGFTDNGDIGQTTYRGALEFGVFGSLGAAADLSFYDFAGDDGGRNVTLHAFYEVLDLATVGAFYAQDSYDEASAEAFGIEATRSMGFADVEGYAGMGEVDGDEFRILGIEGGYDFTDSIGVTGAAAYVDADSGGGNRLAIGGEYRLGRGPALFAEVGRLQRSHDGANADESETYLSLGARIGLGPNGATVFGSRGLKESLSGL